MQPLCAIWSHGRGEAARRPFVAFQSTSRASYNLPLVHVQTQRCLNNELCCPKVVASAQAAGFLPAAVRFMFRERYASAARVGRRRRIVTPPAAIPMMIIAQVDGSGTAATVVLPDTVPPKGWKSLYENWPTLPFS